MDGCYKLTYIILMEKVNLFGLDFWSASDENQVADILIDASNQGLFQNNNIEFIITPNAYDITLFFTRNTDIYDALRHSAVILPDGMPLVWLGKLSRPALKKRITGSDLFPVLWQKIKERKKKAFFILPSQEIGNKLSQEYSDMQFAVPAFFEETDDAYIQEFVSDVIEKIRDLRPDFIFLGLSNPKQQKIALKVETLLHSDDFNCLIAPIGASFEFYLNMKKRAPLFFQKIGGEWFYRLLKEPKRMWKRYTLGNIQFIFLTIRFLAKKYIPKKA